MIHCQSAVEALDITANEIVSITGAGGKTSLLFLLAKELKRKGLKVLVTTTTMMKFPETSQYDFIDTSEEIFAKSTISTAGIYFGALASDDEGKVRSLDSQSLSKQIKRFDITLIEADGAAMKSLKGWNKTEPVIPDFTTTTIGIIDISTIGKFINESLVHRLDLFLKITNARIDDRVSIEHLVRLICHPEGLFRCSRGKEILYINKVESEIALSNFQALREKLTTTIVGGSVKQRQFFP